MRAFHKNFQIVYSRMNMYMSLYLVFLFVVLTPGILLTIPSKGSKLVVAVVHGLVFALVYYLTKDFVLQATTEK